MSEAEIDLNPGSGGSKIRTQQIVENAVNVHQQVITRAENDGIIRDSLMSRMLAKEPQAGWRLWIDTADTAYLYVMEAVAGAATTSTGFQGIRVPLDATTGSPLGQIQINIGVTLTFTNRKTDTGWA